MAYEAMIVRLMNVRPHPKADRLQLATLEGYQVIIGLNHKEGELGVFYPTDGKLSHAHLMANNLYKINPETGEEGNGFFESNRRVKSIGLRGERSDGYWESVQALTWTGYDLGKLKEGDEFSTLNGKKICSKYYTKATKEAIEGRKKIRKRNYYESGMFIKHFDTKELRKNIRRIPENAIIYISEKQHGCVDKSTIIDTLEYGPITIEKIVIERLKVHVKSLNIQTNEIEYIKLDDWYFYANDNDWYKITLEDDTELIITGNNPIWLPDLNCYRRTDELIGNEILLVE